jgi:hypothetical protein
MDGSISLIRFEHRPQIDFRRITDSWRDMNGPEPGRVLLHTSFL